MKAPALTLLLTTTLSLLVPDARAQMPGTPDAGIFNAAIRKIFGPHTAFSSKAEVRLLDAAGKETTHMTLGLSVLNNNTRMDIDMAQLTTKDVSAGEIAQFKSMGMDKMVAISRPDRKSTLVIYPELKSYADLPMSGDEVRAMANEIKVEKTVLGKETVEGHPTQKTKVVLTSKTGERKEATVWYAGDLKEFPVKLQMNEGGTTLVMIYRDIRMERPDAKSFEAPGGFARHASIEQLMQAEVMKRFSGGRK